MNPHLGWIVRFCGLGLACLLNLNPTWAFDARPPITPADYAKWETLSSQAVSPDGKWLAYGITKGDGTRELRLRALDAGDAKVEVIPFGEIPSFSSDSLYVATTVGSADDEPQGRGGPTPGARPAASRARKLTLIHLPTRKSLTIDNVARFAFARDGAYLAMHRPAPTRTEAPAAPASPSGDDKPAPGSDLLVRDLAKGVDLPFGNVASFAWQDQDGSHLLAMVLHPDGNTGRSVQLYDPATGTLRVLDSGAEPYSGLTWRKDADDLAVLRNKSVPDREGATQVILSWRHVADPKTALIALDPTTVPKFPADTRIVASRIPAWASTGETLFVGTKTWPKKAVASKPAAKASGPGTAEKAEGKAEGKTEVAEVEVWHWKDVKIIPEQKLQAERERRKSTLAAWWPGDGAFVTLGHDWAEEVTPLKGGKHAVGVDETPHDPSRMFGRPYVDVFVIDTKTGERKPVAMKLAHLVGASPEGKYILGFRDDHYFAHEVATGKVIDLTRAIQTSFANKQDDHPTPERAPYALGGWTKGDASVLLHDRYDVWEVTLDGVRASRLTRGFEEEAEHRLVKLDGSAGGFAGRMGGSLADPGEGIDPAKPMYCVVSGEWTKKQGIAVLNRAGENVRVDRPIWLDKSVGRLLKAKSADVLAYMVQGFDDSPDLFVAGPDLKEGRQVTETNPFQKDHAWGRAELVEFSNSQGERLQGSLYYPAGYEPGKTYPMVVYIYEKLSRGLHTYAIPSERSPYNPAVFTSKGYFFFSPDIVFRPRDPGISAVDAVEAGVKRVLESGKVDRKRIGVMGHSWGGYETTYLSTRSDLFAAAVAGAPLTDLVSMYGSVYWNNGMPETGHYETGQERMQVPLWEDLEAYRRNSPITFVPEMKTPLLMAFGDKDGAVDWHQGLEMYNLARRAGKPFVLLVYPGENHSLARKPNQIDYHKRIFEWFDHHLKGEPAPAWITRGVEHLEAEKSRSAEK